MWLMTRLSCIFQCVGERKGPDRSGSDRNGSLQERKFLRAFPHTTNKNPDAKPPT